MISIQRKLHITLCVPDGIILDRLEQQRQPLLREGAVYLENVHSLELLEQFLLMGFQKVLEIFKVWLFHKITPFPGQYTIPGEGKQQEVTTMPRVNLCRDPAKERREATRRIIKRGMAEQGIDTQQELARKIGVATHVLDRRMRGDVCWDVDILAKLVKPLRLTEHDAAVILGVSK